MNPKTRRAAILPLFTVVLPLIVLIGAIAINLSSIQLARTELKVSTDAAARAGGRALSEFQDLSAARSFAKQAAALNTVAGQPVDLDGNGASIVFGAAARHGEGRYQFDPATAVELAERRRLSAVRVTASHPSPLVFAIGDTEEIRATENSVASQIDRDIALVIDRSGSMAYFEDEQLLFDTITAFYANSANNITEQEYIEAVSDFPGAPAFVTTGLGARQYSPSVLNLLSGRQLEYAQSFNDAYRLGLEPPTHSRWAALESGCQAFLDFLKDSEQEEIVSLSSFAPTARIDHGLTDNFAIIETLISGFLPGGGTAIGDGMATAVSTLYSPPARPFAFKMMVVFSDGVSNLGVPPLDVGQQLKTTHPDLIIHTITFSEGAAISEMQELARIGDGLHFHADTVDELSDVFRRLAKSFRTIIVE